MVEKLHAKTNADEKKDYRIELLFEFIIFYLDCDEEYPELEIDFDAVARLDAPPVGVPEAEEADEDAELLDELCDVFVEMDFEAVKVDVVVVAVVDDVVEV